MVDRLAAHEIAEIRKAFSVFDVDGDGAITSKELADVMRSFGLNPSEEELMDMINKFDIDGDGMVSFPEFLQMMAPNEDDYQKDIYDVMRLFDPNNNGFIDLREIETILLRFGSTGLEPSPDDIADINEMINELKRAADWSADAYVIRTEDAVTLLCEDASAVGGGEANKQLSQTEKSAKHMISTQLMNNDSEAGSHATPQSQRSRAHAVNQHQPQGQLRAGRYTDGMKRHGSMTQNNAAAANTDSDHNKYTTSDGEVYSSAHLQTLAQIPDIGNGQKTITTRPGATVTDEFTSLEGGLAAVKDTALPGNTY